VPEIHPHYGPVIPEKNWVPAPSFVLRRDRILKLLDPLPRGRLLEVGCGAGTLLYELSMRGFECDAIESSESAFQIAKYLNQRSSLAKIWREPKKEWEGAFDYVVSFEVLEHIKEDYRAMRQWVQWIREGGRLVISVPAHSRRWSASDAWAGHYRRYEKQQVIDLIEGVGLEIEYFECYGYPLANIIEPIRARYHARQLSREQDDVQLSDKANRTNRSGTARSLEAKLYPLQASWIGVVVMKLFLLIQNASSGLDLGTGYLVMARKR